MLVWESLKVMAKGESGHSQGNSEEEGMLRVQTKLLETERGEETVKEGLQQGGVWRK